MNPELIAAEIVDKLPELARDSKLNAHEFIAGKLRAAMTEGWSPAYAEVLKLRREHDRLIRESEIKAMSKSKASTARRKARSAPPYGSAILRDAMRYRFLRSEQSRDHKGHSRRAMSVCILDWGRNLKATNGARPFWSSQDVTGKVMDKQVDIAMRCSPNDKVSDAPDGAAPNRKSKL